MTNSKYITTWYEYDDSGNKIHIKKSNGFEEWSEYDKNGNITSRKNTKNTHIIKKYNSIGKRSYHTHTDDVLYECWWEYNENGAEIHSKNTIGREVKYIYYSNGALKKSEIVAWQYEPKVITEYDLAGNIIYRRESDGTEYWKEYDTNGNLIYDKTKM